MKESVIETRGLTRAYGVNKGVFDLALSVGAGECFGYLGPNGAGKTTTLRLLMGFVRPRAGAARIAGYDCFVQADAVHARVGYLPGELALMEELTGWQFIRLMADLRGLKDLTRARQLADYFELDGRQPIRRLSKGNKQKVGLVCAFMASPPVLLLDEPTSGLDPLGQNRFIRLLLEEKQRGATILLSSHSFEEVERTCDRAAILRSGRIVRQDSLDTLRRGRGRHLTLTFPDAAAAGRFAADWQGEAEENRVTLTAAAGKLPLLLRAAADAGLTDLQSREQSLEESFLHIYGGEA
ncbi:MAG: ABC transporter ATP-binding protein [Gemmiger sp.]